MIADRPISSGFSTNTNRLVSEGGSVSSSHSSLAHVFAVVNSHLTSAHRRFSPKAPLCVPMF